jgi:hypothetical protein
LREQSLEAERDSGRETGAATDQALHAGDRHLPQRRRQWPPVDFVYTRLVRAVLLEQDEHWQLEGRCMFSPESMAAIPALEELPALKTTSD